MGFTLEEAIKCYEMDERERAEAEAEARRLHEEKVRLKAEQGMKRNREIWPKVRPYIRYKAVPDKPLTLDGEKALIKWVCEFCHREHVVDLVEFSAGEFLPQVLDKGQWLQFTCKHDPNVQRNMPLGNGFNLALWLDHKAQSQAALGETPRPDRTMTGDLWRRPYSESFRTRT